MPYLSMQKPAKEGVGWGYWGGVRVMIMGDLDWYEASNASEGRVGKEIENG